MAKATHVSCKISGLLRRRQTVRRSVRLLGDAHALPIDDRRRTTSVVALTILSNNDWHYKEIQYEHANTNLKAKATHVRSKPWCCVAASPFAREVPRSLQIRDLERTSHTQNAVRWFLFGSYVPWTASTLEEKLLTQIPQLGRRMHHPRLDSFVHDLQKPPRERAKRAFMPMVVSPCLPQKTEKLSPKGKKLAELVYPHTFTEFFKLVPKNGWVSFLSNGTRLVTAERAHAKLLRSNSDHVNFTRMRDFNRGHAAHKPYTLKDRGGIQLPHFYFIRWSKQSASHLVKFCYWTWLRLTQQREHNCLYPGLGLRWYQFR